MRPTRLLVPLLLITLLISADSHAKQPEPGANADDTEDATSGDAEATDGESGTDAATDAPADDAPTAPEVDDLEALRAEYFKLRDRLFQSRARAGTVASALYSTRMRVHLNYGSGRYYTVTRATIRLDGAVRLPPR